MAGGVLPTLSDQGYIEGSKTILARLIAYYIETDGQQSLLFRDRLISLPKTYMKFINEPEGMKERVRLDLEQLLNRGDYFDEVEVRTRVEWEDAAKTKAMIVMNVDIIDKNGERVTFGNLVHYDQQGLGPVIGIINYGDAMRYVDARRYEEP